MIKRRIIVYCAFISSIFLSIYIVYNLNIDTSYKIGYFSIVIAVISIGLAILSDISVNSIANANFRRVIGQMEDLRLDLKQERIGKNPETGELDTYLKLYTDREINTWKYVTYVDEAIDILNDSNIKPKILKRFLNLSNSYISQVKILRQYFSIEETTHIFDIYIGIFELEDKLWNRTLRKIEFENKKNEAIDNIRYITEIIEDITIDLDFLKEYKTLISYIINQGLTPEDIRNIRWEMLFNDVKDIFNTQYEYLLNE